MLFVELGLLPDMKTTAITANTRPAIMPAVLRPRLLAFLIGTSLMVVSSSTESSSMISRTEIFFWVFLSE